MKNNFGYFIFHTLEEYLKATLTRYFHLQISTIPQICAFIDPHIVLFCHTEPKSEQIMSVYLYVQCVDVNLRSLLLTLRWRQSCFLKFLFSSEKY